MITGALLDNVNIRNVNKYIKSNCSDIQGLEGMDLEKKINALVDDSKLNVNKLNEFLFDELFCGMHRHIHIYKIKSFRKAKYIDDWQSKFLNGFGVKEINYNKLTQIHLTEDDDIKIGAIRTVCNDENEILKLRMIFIKEVKLSRKNQIYNSYNYIPVEVDFIKNRLILKGRKRQNIINDEHKYSYLIEKIFNKITMEMEISTTPFNKIDEKALYLMSKSSLDDLLDKIPAFRSIDFIKTDVSNLVKILGTKLPIKNKSNNIINTEIMDVDSEINTLVEELILSDYFFDKDNQNIWDSGIHSIITYITFNDKKNAVVRLSGENKKKHIFDSKSFMGLRKSLESVKSVEALKVIFKNGEKKLQITYNADNDMFLKIIFTDYEAYTENEFKLAMEMYEENEQRINEEPKIFCSEKLG